MLFGLSCKQKPILLRLTLLGECVKGAFCFFVIHNCVMWIGRVRSKSVDWLHAAFGNSQIKIWNCSHFREVGEGIEPWSSLYQPKDLNCSLKSPEIRGAKGLSSHPYFSSSRRLIRSTASCHISCLFGFTSRLLPWCNQRCNGHHHQLRMDLLGGRNPLWVMGHESWVMICHGSWLFFVYLFFEFLDYGCKYLEDTSHIVIQRVEGFICEITIGMK